jgi:hypothetical protein
MPDALIKRLHRCFTIIHDAIEEIDALVREFERDGDDGADMDGHPMVEEVDRMRNGLLAPMRQIRNHYDIPY